MSTRESVRANPLTKVPATLSPGCPQPSHQSARNPLTRVLMGIHDQLPCSNVRVLGSRLAALSQAVECFRRAMEMVKR